MQYVPKNAARWLPLLWAAIQSRGTTYGADPVELLAVVLSSVAGESQGETNTQHLGTGAFGLMGTRQYVGSRRYRPATGLQQPSKNPYLEGSRFVHPEARISTYAVSWDPKSQIRAGVGIHLDFLRAVGGHLPSTSARYASGPGNHNKWIAHYADGAPAPEHNRKQHERYIPAHYSKRYPEAYAWARGWLEAGAPSVNTSVEAGKGRERESYGVTLADFEKFDPYTGPVSNPWDGSMTNGTRTVYPPAWGGGGAVDVLFNPVIAGPLRQVIQKAQELPTPAKVAIGAGVGVTIANLLTD